MVQRIQVKHIEDVIKPQEDRTPVVAIDEALALWHLGHEYRVCLIFLSKTPLLYSQNTVMQTPHIRSCGLEKTLS